MGQVGLHGLFGLVVGEKLVVPFVEDRLARRGLMFGFVMGNLAPDLDFISVISMYPIDQTLAIHLHRGFTHSVLAAAATVVGFTMTSALLRDKYLRYIGYGFALGIVGHFTKDMFMWFASVDIFWPASLYGMVPRVDFWFWFNPPPVLGRLMGAAELGAFGLYYDYLTRAAVTLQTDSEMVPMLRRWSTLCWVCWAVLSALALDLPDTEFDLYMYIPMGLIFMPASFYLTWRMQTTIELLGVFGWPRQKQ